MRDDLGCETRRPDLSIHHSRPQSNGDDIRLFLCKRPASAIKGQESVIRSRSSGSKMERPAKAVHRCLARIVRSPTWTTLDRSARTDENNTAASRAPTQGRQRNSQCRHERENVHVEKPLPLGQRSLSRANATHGFEGSRIQDKTVDALVGVLDVLDSARERRLIRASDVSSVDANRRDHIQRTHRIR